jgi:adenylate cyclase
VLDGRVDPDFFKGKIALIGIMATAEPDRYLTSMSRGRPMYGVEILANAIETIWSGRFIHTPALWVQIVMLLVLGMITGLSVVRPWLGLLIMCVLAGMYFLLAVVLFDSQGVLLSLLYPFMSIALSCMIVTAYRLSVEIQQRRRVMRLFEARVSPRVAKEAMQAIEKGQINLGGEVQEITVLFADIRGYTSFAESREPQEVMQMVNTFLGLVGDAVMDYEGTLASYEGDQVMVFYNAPVAQPDHPQRAVESALEVRRRVEQYHASLPIDHPYRVIEFGYGIYTGRAVVGYTGSAQRYEYSALGDTVNIAARLTSVADAGQILIGSSTYDRVDQHIIADPLPPIAIRGRIAPVSIFSVVGAQDQSLAEATQRLVSIDAAEESISV